ncbi:hypothetical protein ACOMHN_027693 [Nucella lapillus]
MIRYTPASGEGDNNMDSLKGTPSESGLLTLIERTGFPMVQENGQRKFGPPPTWKGPPPPRGSEIFIGKIPRDIYEDELVPVFEKVGPIYEFRLMMDFSGSNRGYAFCMYTSRGDAKRAIKELNNYEIKKGRLLGVCSSVDNCRLFVGGIPKNKNREDILSEMAKVTEGVVDVIVYPSAVDKTKNRGFAFVEYESHRAAAMARRKLIPGRIQLWGHQIAVDWAEPEQDVDEDTMSQVKILYVRNLMLATTEEALKDFFSRAAGGCEIERVKKIRDYAFVHFKSREDAVNAMKTTNGSSIEGSEVEVVLAKPVDKSDLRLAKTRGIQVYGLEGYEAAAAPFATQAFNYGQMIPQAGRGIAQRGTCTIPLRGLVRGRGRGSAGSRGAGGSRLYMPSGGYRRHPLLVCINPLLVHVSPLLVHINPFTKPTAAPGVVKQILEEFCQKNGLGCPVYQLHSTMHRSPTGQEDIQLFLFKVSVPALMTQNAGPFQPDKLCRTVEEAKVYAAEYVLLQLGVHIERGFDYSQAANYPPPTQATGPAVYQTY